MANPNTLTLGGAPEGFDAQLILREIEKSGQPVVHVARDDKRMAAMQAALRFFAPDMPVLLFPGWDCLPYDRVSPNADISAARMATLAALVHGAPKQFVLLTTISAAMQRVPAREVLREAAFTARVDGQVDEAALRGFLVRMGFTQSPTVMEPGDYAVRGGIIDIFPQGTAGRCVWICLAMYWTAHAVLIPSASAQLKSWRWSNWPLCQRLFWTRPRSAGSVRTTASNLAPRAPMIRCMRR